MAKKSIRLRLLDANVVLELHRLGLWEVVVEGCEILLARTVVEESKYFETRDGRQERIDLGRAIESEQLTVVEVDLGVVRQFRERFTRTFLERLDPGELESLAYLVEVDKACRISSADAIVWRTLGALALGEQGLSLEEILNAVGQTRKLSDQFTKPFRERCTKRGFDEGLRGEAKR